jgi:uncharacterized membrane protein
MRIDNVGKEPCSIGLDQGVAVLLAYLLSWVGGLVFYFVEKQNRFVRFSAMQSIIIGALWVAVALTFSILSGLPGLGILFRILSVLVNIGFVALSVALIVLGFKAKKLVLPFIGELADRWSDSPES